jgi:hypothetical protein
MTLAVNRLNASSRRAAATALGILSVLLDEDERVEALVTGKLFDRNAAAVVTPQRLLIVSDREWHPDVVEITVDSGLTVQGWQDDRSATLVFESGETQAVFDRITDRELAREMADLLRSRSVPEDVWP